MSTRNGSQPRTDYLPPRELRGKAPEPEPTRLLDAAEVGRRWGVPAAHVLRLAREGRLPVTRLGKYRRFRIEALEEWEAAGGTE